ncbi:MAG: agmatine deiminase [Thermotogota bacterium]
MILKGKPVHDGFIMPAEFESHSGCYMLWPYRSDIWREAAVPAGRVFATVANLISTSERVYMGIREQDRTIAKRYLSPQITLINLAYNDAWMRDIGPTFLKNRKKRKIRAIDWNFNAWGGTMDGLYKDWKKDSLVCSKLFEKNNIDYYKPSVVLEGGAIHVDGKGTLIAVEECVLNKNRNPELNKQQMEIFFSEYLGIKKTIWLPKGVYNDETNGHVDNLCCFAPDGVVLLTWTDDESDPQFEISQQAYDILNNESDARGTALKVDKIHQPGPFYMEVKEQKGLEKGDAKNRHAGDRLAASYINFYISNASVILPVFDDFQDTQAIEKIQGHFPKRSVIPVYSREILLGGGNIHCITQQIPKV